MTVFETQSCSRCGGSGHHSSCQRYGTICFKCHGAQRVYTKRGEAAKLFFLSLFPTKPATELVPGDVYRERAGEPWATVLAPIGPPVVSGWSGVERTPWFTVPVFHTPVKSEWGTIEHSNLNVDSRVTLRPDAATIARFKAEALAYQQTLLKTGKPAKKPGALRSQDRQLWDQKGA